MMLTRYRGTLLGITREPLLDGTLFWVVEPVGRHLEVDRAGRRVTHRLPVRLGFGLREALAKSAEDLDTLEVDR